MFAHCCATLMRGFLLTCSIRAMVKIRNCAQLSATFVTNSSPRLSFGPRTLNFTSWWYRKRITEGWISLFFLSHCLFHSLSLLSPLSFLSVCITKDSGTYGRKDRQCCERGICYLVTPGEVQMLELSTAGEDFTQTSIFDSALSQAQS